MIDRDEQHAIALDALAAQDASGLGSEIPPYAAPRCECGAELVGADYDDVDGRLVQTLICEACDHEEEPRQSERRASLTVAELQALADAPENRALCAHCGMPLPWYMAPDEPCEVCEGPMPEQLELNLNEEAK